MRLRGGSKNTQKNIQNSLNDPENHESVVNYLEPDILECEGRWALSSITTNKARGSDGIPDELLQILKR